MDDAFGSWLSGITDGESCFLIELQKPNQHQNYIKYRGSFTIALRADDVDVLNQIKATLGFGHVYPRLRSRKVKNSKPQFVYRVASIEDCCQLVELFDRFKLRSKKLKDYLIWREFILYKRDNFRNNKKLKDYTETLEMFYHKLKNIRHFTKERED